MKDKALRTCPKCKKAKLERLIGTGGAIIFKGGGFYQTDYRSESYNKAAEAEKKSTSEPSGGSGGESKGAEASTPSKPASDTKAEKATAPKGAAKTGKGKST